MKSINITLPDSAYAEVVKKAEEYGMNVSGISSLLVVEGLAKSSSSAQTQPMKSTEHNYDNFTNEFLQGEGNHESKKTKAPELTRTVPSTDFDVAANFPGINENSVSLAQAFVDEALSFAGVKAFKNDRGIGFQPNFVWIEYIRLRDYPGGFVASFYGVAEDFNDPPPRLKAGRGQSYSRADIYDEEDLKAVIPIIKQSWELRNKK